MKKKCYLENETKKKQSQEMERRSSNDTVLGPWSQSYPLQIYFFFKSIYLSICLSILFS